MKNKNTKVIGIITAFLPALYAIFLMAAPFYEVVVERQNLVGVMEKIPTRLKLLQLYNDSRSILLLLFIGPAVINLVAALLSLIVQKKGSFIFESVAATIGTIFSLGALVSLKSVFNVIFETYSQIQTGSTEYGSLFTALEKVDFQFSWGFWLSLFFVIAALVMSLITIKLINDEQGDTAAAGAPAQRAAAPMGGGAIRPAAPVQAAPSAHQIICISGEFANASFPINPNETVVIGRDSAASNIVIVAPKVSRKHCTITFDSSKNMFNVVDCSTNGTFTENGTRLMANMNNPLPSGTIISLGSNENRFKLV